MSSSVLVLNANFEPLNVCDIRRALGLILTDKATMVLNGRGEIHSACKSFPSPSVIRLQYMVHRPRVHIKLTRREIFRRDNYTCQYCGKVGGNLTVDHIIPRHLHGQHDWTNLVTACSACNHRKGGRTIMEAELRLLRQPKEPSSSAAYVFGRHAKEYTEWQDFLTGW
ncbi:MAG: HNH endonuclease [Anaerolineaceae bacterium]|nr:HNH endonuclease [Anaerolineaceae bacterium]